VRSKRAGFKVVRIRGSHHVLRHPDGRGTSVPVHRNQDVRIGTLRGILRDCGLTADEFLNLLDLRQTTKLSSGLPEIAWKRGHGTRDPESPFAPPLRRMSRYP
jgi:predicted RNA binding protein YcfA (HicA-like mRNA interferase family)